MYDILFSNQFKRSYFLSSPLPRPRIVGMIVFSPFYSCIHPTIMNHYTINYKFKDLRKMKRQKTFNQELDHILQVLDAEIKKKEC